MEHELADTCLDAGVKKLELSTDKASSPVNLYGATKLVSDKVFVAGNVYRNENNPFCRRYGNVMGSRGSVIPFFLDLDKNTPSPITDLRMTRFMISLKDGVELVTHAFEDMIGGEIYVKKIPSMKITDLALACRPLSKQQVVGVRPGEKIHEQMIGPDDAPYTYEYDAHYKILPSVNNWHLCTDRIANGKKVPDDFEYSSESNADWMSIEELQKWIADNRQSIGSI